MMGKFYEFLQSFCEFINKPLSILKEKRHHFNYKVWVVFILQLLKLVELFIQKCLHTKEETYLSPKKKNKIQPNNLQIQTHKIHLYISPYISICHMYICMYVYWPHQRVKLCSQPTASATEKRHPWHHSQAFQHSFFSFFYLNFRRIYEFIAPFPPL